jgi:putative hydrolase of the HAD superfamily
MARIKAVIFDVGGVLHNETFSATMDALTKELETEQSTLKEIWRTQIPLLGAGKINEAEFWQAVHTAHGIRQVELTENLLGKTFAAALTPHIEVLALVAVLKKKGFKLAVLSNTIEPHAEALRAAGIYDGFDSVLLSHEIGIRKPDPRIYAYMLNALHVTAEETLFIDDDASNIQAAQTVGITGIVYTNPDQLLVDLERAIPELRQA